MSSLRTLDMFNMRLTGTMPAAVLHNTCKPFGSQCTCQGLPPLSCAAFGPHARLSLTSIGACVHCPATAMTIAKLILAAVLLPLSIALYVLAVARHPHFKTWIATSSIVLSHLQVVGLIGSLITVGGVSSPLFEMLRAVLVVCGDLGAVSPQCLLPQQPRQKTKLEYTRSSGVVVGEWVAVFDWWAFLTSPSFVGAVTAVAIPAMALLGITVAKLATTRKLSATSAAEPSTSILALGLSTPADESSTSNLSPDPTPPLPSTPHLSAPAPALASAPAPASEPAPVVSPPPSPPNLVHDADLAVAALTSAKAMAVRQVDVYENWAVIVYSLQLPTVCRVSLNTIVLGSVGTSHPSLFVGIPIMVFEGAYMLRLFRKMRALQGHRSLFGHRLTALPFPRLLVRLEYLRSRYADHAPYWQFVLWARQFALVLISACFSAFDSHGAAMTESLSVLSVLVVALMLHIRYWPFAHRYQNLAETVLASSSILAVVVACIFSARNSARMAADSLAVFEVSIAGMLLGPVGAFGAWLAASRKWPARVCPPSTSSSGREPLLPVDDAEAESASLHRRHKLAINVSDVPPRSVASRAPLVDADELVALREQLGAALPSGPPHSTGVRYTANAADLIVGDPGAAALGIMPQLSIPEHSLRRRMAKGVQAIVDECEAQLMAGAERGGEDMRWLEHVLYEPAASPEDLREEGRAGQPLAHFTGHPNALRAGLSAAHVVALRWYTTEAHLSINGPLRDVERRAPHPYAATVTLIAEGIGRLRALEAPESLGGAVPRRLWRAARNVCMPDELLRCGGTDLAPLSCTTNLALVARFAASRASLLFLVSAEASSTRLGASLQWLSVYPSEQEYVFPPCTYLKPTGRIERVEVTQELVCTVVEVEVLGAGSRHPSPDH